MSANNKPINAWLPSLAESVTSCPCPPEVSEHIPDTDKAETDGDILLLNANFLDLTGFSKSQIKLLNYSCLE